jgi:hypothetical protein
MKLSNLSLLLVSLTRRSKQGRRKWEGKGREGKGGEGSEGKGREGKESVCQSANF